MRMKEGGKTEGRGGADLAGAASSASGSARRALLVEDDEPLARLAALFLKRLGFEATVCRDGIEAEAKFAAFPDAFDVVLTDVNMPHMSGIELGRRLLAVRAGVPVLLCTGGSDPEAEEAVRDKGFRGIVTKPFTLSSLGAALQMALSKQDSASAGK